MTPGGNYVRSSLPQKPEWIPETVAADMTLILNQLSSAKVTNSRRNKSLDENEEDAESEICVG